MGAGDEVTGLSRSADEPQTAGAGRLSADLLDARAAADAVAQSRPEVVYHLAALASVSGSWERPDETLSENTLATLHLLEAVRSHAPEAVVLVVGSGEIYGPPESLPVDEDAPLRPQNPYAVSKAAVDLLAAMYADAHGLRTIRVRAFNHAGPRQGDAYVVSTLARQVAAGLEAGEDPIRLVTGNPEPRRDFTDVRDVVRAYRLLAQEATAGAFNVCSGHATSVAELDRHVARGHRSRDRPLRGSGAGARARGDGDPRLPRAPERPDRVEPRDPAHHDAGRRRRLVARAPGAVGFRARCADSPAP